MITRTSPYDRPTSTNVTSRIAARANDQKTKELGCSLPPWRDPATAYCEDADHLRRPMIAVVLHHGSAGGPGAGLAQKDAGRPISEVFR